MEPLPTTKEIELARALLEIRRTLPGSPTNYEGAYHQIQSIAASSLNHHAAAYRQALVGYNADNVAVVERVGSDGGYMIK